MNGKVRRIEVEGIDKTGKTQLVYYLRHLSGFRLAVSDRGVATCMALNSLHGAQVDAPDDVAGSVIVYLKAEPEDWSLRCSMTNEPPIPCVLFTERWDAAIDELERRGARVLRFNTSEETVYCIARKVLDALKEEK